jgi:hypothetical protein
MNKIKLLYEVTRAMRNQEKIGGTLQAHLRKDQEEIAALRTSFETNEAGKSRIKVSSELNLNGGHVKRESTTEFDFPGHCRPGSGMMRGLFHRHHGHDGCCGIKGVLTRLSLAFGILSSLKVEEKGNGAALVSLSLNDIPEELAKVLLEKMQFKNDCLMHHGILKERHRVETLDGTLVMTVSKDHIIETITANMESTALDENSGLHTMAAIAEVQFT